MAGLVRRTFVKRALATGIAWPLLRVEEAQAQSIEDYISQYVHSELRPMARASAAMTAGMPAWTPQSLPQLRAGAAAYGRARLPAPAVEKRTISGEPGRPLIPVWLINAQPGSKRPAILHLHGGGFVMGAAEQSIADLQAICTALDCFALSVDYRLAPETTFAGSVEDNYAALTWLHTNAEALGVDPARIGVMGESAGGGHAALLAIAARDRGEVPLAFQCLIYPMLDDRTGTTRTMPPHVGRLMWTAESNRFGWHSFLGMEPGGPSVPAHAVPSRVADVVGLPPAFIGVGSLDLFCDEDTEYAQRLNAAGVATELVVVPGAFHGFDMMPSKISQRFNSAKLNALRLGLESRRS
ncbi:hypothetical protein GCM10011494_35970 [Novosphingobium endophyticum]|uniref:Alpha/beta hydrolase fold-3 domain-containing protein n=1 Tax=Novosphingobium endophyticum TaxID=1955250 RepID=A0A916X617_9SPHN|nr:alpha/beta hydrolase [Novosphingobium endophyticum]GGC13972.1 hypothetical protein GCM10011494_35970 [Novosphingobium endophyticum]